MGNNKIIQILLVVIALVLIAAGIIIIKDSYQVYQEALSKDKLTNFNLLQQGYAQALSYFYLALGVILVNLLLPRLQSITLPGGISLTL
jgi:hypothetical protein